MKSKVWRNLVHALTSGPVWFVPSPTPTLLLDRLQLLLTRVTGLGVLTVLLLSEWLLLLLLLLMV